MIYNIFNTEQDAINAENADWVKYQADLPTSKVVDGETISIDNTRYLSVTTCWDCPKQRLDGKWIYHKYDGSSASHTEEEHNSSWFPSEEE